MPLFGNKKKSAETRRMILRFTLEYPSTVSFTLDQGESGRVWHTGRGRLVNDAQIEAATSFEQMVNSMVEGALSYIRERVPSLKTFDISVQVERESDPGEIVCVGPVEFTSAEWERLRPVI